MAFEHNFSVGKPDNLVYIIELLNLLEEKLEKMVSAELYNMLHLKYLAFPMTIIDNSLL